MPGDNDDEVAARGILYLLIFQQLGQLVRWSWGYHVLLAPPEKYEQQEQQTNSQLEQGRYHDEPGEYSDDTIVDDPIINDNLLRRNATNGSYEFESGELTPVTQRRFTFSKISLEEQRPSLETVPELMPTPVNGNVKPRNTNGDGGQITSFPSIRSAMSSSDGETSGGARGLIVKAKALIRRYLFALWDFIANGFTSLFQSLPASAQKSLGIIYTYTQSFLHGVWDFMNPPLWAMLVAIIVASVPALQHVFFSEGSFIANSATRAVAQSGGVAVPLILVVLGANLARNTLPNDEDRSADDKKEDQKLLVACLVSRMLLPTLVMAPLLALMAKYIPVSILDDPIFVIVCFLLTGAPSALQLAQICQINGVYMSVMSKLLFQSYVIW